MFILNLVAGASESRVDMQNGIIIVWNESSLVPILEMRQVVLVAVLVLPQLVEVEL